MIAIIDNIHYHYGSLMIFDIDGYNNFLRLMMTMFYSSEITLIVPKKALQNHHIIIIAKYVVVIMQSPISDIIKSLSTHGHLYLTPEYYLCLICLFFYGILLYKFLLVDHSDKVNSNGRSMLMICQQLMKVISACHICVSQQWNTTCDNLCIIV